MPMILLELECDPSSGKMIGGIFFGLKICHRDRSPSRSARGSGKEATSTSSKISIVLPPFG